MYSSAKAEDDAGLFTLVEMLVPTPIHCVDVEQEIPVIELALRIVGLVVG